MSSSLPSEFSKEISKSFKAYSAKYGSKFTTILNSIFKSFTSNQASFTSKVSKLMEELGESELDNFNSFYNVVLKLVTFVYKERYTSDQLESELAEIGKNAVITSVRVAERDCGGVCGEVRRVQPVHGRLGL
jgi:hypothetical protein